MMEILYKRYTEKCIYMAKQQWKATKFKNLIEILTYYNVLVTYFNKSQFNLFTIQK